MLSEIVCLLWLKGTFLPACTNRGCYATQILLLIKINVQNPRGSIWQERSPYHPAEPVPVAASICQASAGPEGRTWAQVASAGAHFQWPVPLYASSGPQAGLLGNQGSAAVVRDTHRLVRSMAMGPYRCLLHWAVSGRIAPHTAGSSCCT